MNLIPLNFAFEDQISEFVMMKMVDKTQKFIIGYSYTEGGFGYLKENIRGWNDASKGTPFFVLTDLDTKNCAPELIRSWINAKKHPNLIFRVAVRQVESWLISDIEGFSKFSGVSEANFNKRPELIKDPKNEILRLIKKCKKRKIKEDILPKDKFASVGPNYNDRLSEFVISFWDIDIASIRSESLKRAMAHLQRFTYHTKVIN